MNQLVLHDVRTVLEESSTALVAAQIASGVARNRNWPANSVSPQAVHRHIVELLRCGEATLVPHSIVEQYEGYPSHYRQGECFFLGSKHLRSEHAQVAKGPTTRYWRRHHGEVGHELQFAGEQAPDAQATENAEAPDDIAARVEPPAPESVEPLTPAATMMPLPSGAIPHITDVLARAAELRQRPVSVRRPLRLALISGGGGPNAAITPMFSSMEEPANAAPQRDVEELFEYFGGLWQELARDTTGLVADAILRLSQRRVDGQSPYTDEEIEKVARLGALVCDVAEQHRDLVEQLLGSVDNASPQRTAIN